MLVKGRRSNPQPSGEALHRERLPAIYFDDRSCCVNDLALTRGHAVSAPGLQGSVQILKGLLGVLQGAAHDADEDSSEVLLLDEPGAAVRQLSESEVVFAVEEASRAELAPTTAARDQARRRARGA